ncbi:Abortive infection bacteriophage resistance protein [Granulicatella balaenopterae]|uniref:Abortive infection bacteriophage resistance protein n=1 Tax=Granulicatella balaenopterae TaxID=137733 RepID=A0A1H9MCQ6_9LACT|nr:Abi family protein [Granulicatella balaenopterae]SER21550.1 Abortive infection bacteriophage resistance protein [Granulicatella balaenopterae]
MEHFLALEHQITTLQKRGLSITNVPKAEQYLLENNYFNVIHGYSQYFFKFNSKHYLPGTTFDEVAHLHYFDKELQSLLFKHIMDAESHFKSILAYHFAKYHENTPIAYLNPNSYSGKIEPNEINGMIKHIQRVTKHRMKDYDTSDLQPYYEAFNHPPIWAIIDYLTLGEVIQFYEYLPKRLRTTIAHQFTPENAHEFINYNIIVNYLQHIKLIRNAVAHNYRMLDFSYDTNLAFYSAIYDGKVSKNCKNRNKVYHIYLVLELFLTENQYAQFHNTLLKRIKNLDNKITVIPVNNILQSLGFPDDWHLTTKKIEQKG